MNFGITNLSGTGKAILDKTEGNVLWPSEGKVGAIFTDVILPETLESKFPVVNTTREVIGVMTVAQLTEAFMENVGINPTAESTSVLYSIFNGSSFSDWIEISYSNRLMDREVGPRLNYTTGVGLRVEQDIFAAIKGLSKLRDFLLETKYMGEIAVSISPEFVITGIQFGHSACFFAMYSEMCTCDVQTMLDFSAGLLKKLEVYDTCCVSNLVSKAPFPWISDFTSTMIQAPRGAEKHFWRFESKSGEYGLVVTHGKYIREARQRLLRTIQNMLHYDQDLQYRTDFGWNRKFVLEQVKYDLMCKEKFIPQTGSTSGDLPCVS